LNIPLALILFSIVGENSRMPLRFTTSYLEDSVSVFRQYKKLAESAMAQVTEEQLFAALDDEMNSIAVIVKHMAGNMRSRWTDLLTTDGEKPDRDRDAEFISPPPDRASLNRLWEDGWECIFSALASLSDSDLDRTITIRGEPHSVTQAINRQVAHYSYHCGQIVFLAKHFAHDRWKSPTIPRNRSAEFNRRVVAKELSQR